MQEALLVEIANNGGPSGPGSGIGETQPTTPPPGPPPLPPPPFRPRFPFRRRPFGPRRFPPFRRRMPGGPGPRGPFPGPPPPGIADPAQAGFGPAVPGPSGVFPGEQNPQVPSFDPTQGGISSTVPSTPAVDAYVSTIQEDAYGLYYIFSAGSDGLGIRVNITKSGFCEKVRPHEPTMCMHMCYSDDQCPGNAKCCPSRCALDCTEPPVQAGQSVAEPSIVSPRIADPTPIGGKFSSKP